MKWLQRIFGAQVRPGVELVAGLTTFLTMAYVITANPEILSTGTGMGKPALIAATCLVTAVVTMATGLLANAPIAMAPGMGLNAFFAFVLCGQHKMPWQTALGVVFLSGLVFLVLSLAGLRRRLVEAVPRDLLHAIAAGIGIFIAFIGLQNMGLVVRGEGALLITFGKFSPEVLIGLAGLMAIIVMQVLDLRGSLLLGIILATILAVLCGRVAPPEEIFDINLGIAPVLAKLDILAALKFSLLAPIFTLMFMDLFDSVGSLLACAQEAEMTDAQGHVPKLDRLLALDAGATMFGALCGTSTTTTYIESASGITAGGRTGLTSVVTGLCFLLAAFFVPVVAIVPPYATAPALIMVGYFMMRNARNIDFSDLAIGIPSFLIVVMIAFSFSISHGLAFGFAAYTIIKLLQRQWRELKPAMWVIFVLCLIYFVVEGLA